MYSEIKDELVPMTDEDWKEAHAYELNAVEFRFHMEEEYNKYGHVFSPSAGPDRQRLL